jgi:predicted RNA-binding protein YlxR (DUF448 family)/ribosomal protein L30E
MSRETLPTEQLVRFVVAPDGVVVPDVAGKLPGRGLWLHARRDIVAAVGVASAFSRVAGVSVTVPEGLADRVEGLLARRCLELVGLARRAGKAVAGYEKVRGLLSHGRAGAVIQASDGAAGGRDKLRALARDVPMIGCFTSAELGGVFGRDTTVHAAIARDALAGRLIAEAGRLAGFRCLEDGTGIG